jgi:hypothetical protein
MADMRMQEAARQLGRTRADVEAALRAAPLHPALAELLRAAAALEAQAGEAVDVVILSDANTVGDCCTHRSGGGGKRVQQGLLVRAATGLQQRLGGASRRGPVALHSRRRRAPLF